MYKIKSKMTFGQVNIDMYPQYLVFPYFNEVIKMTFLF